MCQQHSSGSTQQWQHSSGSTAAAAQQRRRRLRSSGSMPPVNTTLALQASHLFSPMHKLIDTRALPDTCTCVRPHPHTTAPRPPRAGARGGAVGAAAPVCDRGGAAPGADPDRGGAHEAGQGGGGRRQRGGVQGEPNAGGEGAEGGGTHRGGRPNFRRTAGPPPVRSNRHGSRGLTQSAHSHDGVEHSREARVARPANLKAPLQRSLVAAAAASAGCRRLRVAAAAPPHSRASA